MSELVSYVAKQQREITKLQTKVEDLQTEIHPNKDKTGIQTGRVSMGNSNSWGSCRKSSRVTFDQVYSSPPVVSLSVSQLSADPEEELWYKVVLGSLDVAGF